MTALSTQPYKGTRDFYPEDMRVRQWMFSKLRTTLKEFGYLEYDGPMLEPFELYASKTSEEIVNEQLYWFEDRGGRKLAIRPEMTPTLARMVAAKQNQLPKPIRWFSIPNLWRYERPQRGRLREHWQLNVDVFGGSVLAEDLEICQVICAIMASFGAKKGFEVRLNHRSLTNSVFTELLKLPAEKNQSVGRLLDAAHKLGKEVFSTELQKQGLEKNQIELLVSLLEPDAAQRVFSKLRHNPAAHHLNKILESLNALGLSSFFRYDPSIMRGFLYYTGTVMEVYDLHPENNRALFGGGRYDDLVGMFGGKRLSGVGFGMGDVTLKNFLQTHELLPDFSKPSGVYIGYLEEDCFLEAQKLAHFLREKTKNLTVLTALHAEKPKKIFESAEKLKAKKVVFVGPDDIKAGKFPLKDLETKEQKTGTAQELLEVFLS